MKMLKSVIIGFIILLFLMLSGCITKYPVLGQPDMRRFTNIVTSTALQDSLQAGKLTVGMPYYVVREIFNEWKRGKMADIGRDIASIGSRQRLREVEGFGRGHVDPDIKIYLDEYKTREGKLIIWYQFPDFYRMDVSVDDILCVFLEDTVCCSTIMCLKDRDTLCVEDSLSIIPQDQDLYGEIYYEDHNHRDTTYWYKLRYDGKTYFYLDPPSFIIYPIEQIELDGKRVSSYKWR